ILQETVRSLQIRASALLARVPELRSAHDIKMSLFEMADDIETKISVLEAYGTNKIPASIFADLDEWFKGNTQELQETLKFLDDFDRCLQATSSSSSPQSTALAIAPVPTQEPANNNTPTSNGVSGGPLMITQNSCLCPDGSATNDRNA
ncbi:hypothetical protein KEM55_000280, partial [Ascosphaera atra]